MKKQGIVIAAALALGGCQTITGWADSLGGYMPVIGERCDHWECMTDEGQAQSDMTRAMKEQQEKQEQAPPPPSASPAAPERRPFPNAQ